MGRTGSESSRRLPRHLRYEDIPTHTFTPRTYQVELLDAAVQQNTLVCLGATSSCMFLSVMLLKELGHQLQQPLDQAGKRGVFLVNNAEDIAQYALVIGHHTDLTVGQYATDCKDRDQDWWATEIQKSQAMVMLPRFFQYLVEENLLRLSQVNVLIFDHCQHVLDPDHPYDRITRRLDSQSEAEESPRILGLTSCFTSNHCQDPVELITTIKQLEKRFNASAETSTLVYSERYGMRPTELVFECDRYEDHTGMVEELEVILENALQFLQECNITLDSNEDPIETPKTVIVECLNILYRLGPWCAVSLAQMFVSQLEKIDKHETNDVKKKFLRMAATQLRLLINHFENNFAPEYDIEELLMYTTPKVKKLVDHLRQFKPDCDFKIISSEDADGLDDDSYMSDDSLALTDSSDDEDRSGGSKIIHVAVKKDIPEDKSGLQLFSGSDDKYLCGIVFVDHRYVAFALNKFIEEVCAWDDQLCFIKSHHITGQGSKKEGSKSYKKQEEILRKFRLQELNLLLATDVLEEGVDIPKCNLIVKFDPPKDYRSYSQSKGRARARESEYVILADKSNLKSFRTELAKYKDIEGVLKGIWKANDSENEMNCNNIVDLYHDILPPYKPGNEEGGVQVTLTSAIALVNRYCAKLPSDAFTHLTPKCTISSTQKGEQTVYSATLRLPINSPMKEEIQGIPMPTKMLAKQAVALKACEILHKSGEIDDQLLPVGKELFMKEEEDSSAWDAEDLAGEARPGTTKRKQYYIKQLGSSLVKGHPREDKNFLYLIHLTLTQPISDDQNTRGRRVYTPDETKRGFGLLSSNFIPKIPTFPLYTRSGEVTVSLDLLQIDALFTHDELIKLREFHRFVFTEVLRLEKDPMEFHPDKAELGYCIIPLNKTDGSDYFVDWGFIDLVKQSKQTVKRNIYDSKREIFEFNKQEYEDAVVMPSYRNIDQPQHFYVAEIRSDLNPSSAFPSPELYKTFSEYYTTKYGLTVTNQEQPLLDVDHTSARLNLLTPRYMNQKGVALPTSSAETKKARRENLQQKQILVPELCEVHVFPSSLWRKAVCLPTILYRVNYLLVAEEIRIQIATRANIGQVVLPEGFQFPALDFGFSLQDEKDSLNGADKKNLMTENKGTSEENESLSENVHTEQITGQLGNDTVERIAVGNAIERNTGSDQLNAACENVKSSADHGLVDCENVKSSADHGLVDCENVKSSADHGLVDCENLKSSHNKMMLSIDCVKSQESVIENEVVDTADVVTEENNKTVEKESDVDMSRKNQALQSNKGEWADNSSQKNISVKAEEDDTSQETPLICEDSGVPTCNGTYADDKQCILDKDCDKSQCLQSKNTPVDSHYCDQQVVTKCIKCCEMRNNHSCGLSSNGLVKEFSKLTTDCASKDDKSVSDSFPGNENRHKLDQAERCDIKSDCDSTEHSTASGWGDTPNNIDMSTGSWSRYSVQSLTQSNNESNCEQPNKPDSLIIKKDLAEEEKSKMEISQHRGDEGADVFTSVGHFGKSSKRKVKVPVDLSKVAFPDPLLSLDVDIDLSKYIGPSPCTILQALTMSNANDFFSLERLETIGDSFLKYAITVYLYCTYPGIHEGKLSYLRSKQVSNCNLYRLGKRTGLAECMISTKFEPYENWLPPGYIINETKRKGPVPHVVLSKTNCLSKEPHEKSTEKKASRKLLEESKHLTVDDIDQQILDIDQWRETEEQDIDVNEMKAVDMYSYCLQTLHSIPDKSIADCVESLIGCYLTSCGKKAALRFMYSLGLKVLPPKVATSDDSQEQATSKEDGVNVSCYGYQCPPSPLLSNTETDRRLMDHLLIGYTSFEEKIGYQFSDRAYLLQAFTHASYHYNNITDCYQRLEFLGDAILDYVITRHLYEDSCKYSPGVLTDLRSALVNNNIFAALAVKWDFHKYFKAISPPLFQVIEKFVARQKEREDEIDLEDEDENEDASEEYVELEVPKALGDIFESLAGAIYLDSGLSLDVVWKVYYRMMKPQIDKYLKSIPKSPVRELLEMEPETAKFEKPERTLEGKIRVTVNVVSKGVFVGIGRNYRIAKSAAAKKALRCIKAMQTQGLV